MPLRIVAAFDTETSNVGNIATGRFAFPCLYQLGVIEGDIMDIDASNVADRVKLFLYRNHGELYSHMDRIIDDAKGYVPVVLVHNLGFDMYALAPWLLNHEVKPLAKTAKKPISFQIMGEDGKTPCMVILDTLGLFMKSLSTLGEECGMPKAVGQWDYKLVRHASTPLSENERTYASRDVLVLVAYMSHFLRKNPDINPSMIGQNVQTKTGVVRVKRLAHVGKLKGRRLKRTVEQYWRTHNASQRPKSDRELFTMHASTRGGFTFCASNNAGVVFEADGETRIVSYDSTSQHPAQMVSHLYPIGFHECDSDIILETFNLCQSVSLDSVLNHWAMPFPYAFDACFEFENLRMRPGTIFESEGICTLASARFGHEVPLYDNEAAQAFKENIGKAGYKDTATGQVFLFGKMQECDKCQLYLTELEAWVLGRVYVWDGVKCKGGFFSHTFRKPPDMAVLSVMRFYRAKDALKAFMSSYAEGQDNDTSGIAGYYPASFVEQCANGSAEPRSIAEYYALAKADLNALFGIEATNEARRDYKLVEWGLELTGEDGLCNLPKRSKCDYYFGQRIVGWSRVAQICILELIAQHVEHVVCGDTDSLKCIVKAANLPGLEDCLRMHAACLDRAKSYCTKRVRIAYKADYDPLAGIGHYVEDGNYDAFCAAWNKAYIALSGSKVHVTLAGVPTSRRTETSPGEYVLDSYDDYCMSLMRDCGYTFAQVAALAIGYNVTIDHTITKLNLRLHPEFGSMVDCDVCDYLGNVARVSAPAALALFPGSKTIGDTSTAENLANLGKALENNPNVNSRPVWVRWEDGKPIVEGFEAF